MVLFWATPSACLHGADAQAVREAAQQGAFITSELGEESGVSLADGGVVHVFRGGRRARVFEPGGCSAVRCAAVEACVGLGLDVAFCRGHEIRQPVGTAPCGREVASSASRSASSLRRTPQCPYTN